MISYAIHLKPLVEHISDRDLERFCAINPELRFETNAGSNLIVIPNSTLTGEKIYRHCFKSNYEIASKSWVK